MTWLCCDTDKSNPTVVYTLWCHACRTSEAKIIGMKNYSSVWIFSKFKRKAHPLPHFHLTELSNSGARTAKQQGELTELPEKEYRPRDASTGPSSSVGPSSLEGSSTDTEQALSPDDWDDLFNWSFRLTILCIVYSCIMSCIMQVKCTNLLYCHVFCINCYDVRSCLNKISVGLTHCQINLKK